MTEEQLTDFRAKLPEKLRIFVSTPCDDGHRLCYWNSIRALERTPDPAGNEYYVHATPGDSLIPRARNNHAHDFRKSGFDLMLTIDSDLDFRPQDVWGLVARRLPIVAGQYAIKQRDLRWCVNTIPGESVNHETGLCRVATAGTGALLYHRSVLDAMIAAAAGWEHWRMRYVDDMSKEEKYHFFHHGVIDDPIEFAHSHNPRDMSEDWNFCYLARKLGFDVWLDTRAIFMHEGTIQFPIDMRRLTFEEVQSGMIQQPDGSSTPIRPDMAAMPV
jgi:hypothetical protein